jgi:hypothetical protein
MLDQNSTAFVLKKSTWRGSVCSYHRYISSSVGVLRNFCSCLRAQAFLENDLTMVVWGFLSLDNSLVPKKNPELDPKSTG